MVRTGEQKEKIKKVKALIKKIRQMMEDHHPNWQECEVCAMPMSYLLDDGLFEGASISFSYIRERMRRVMRHLKEYSEEYADLQKYFIDIYGR